MYIYLYGAAVGTADGMKRSTAALDGFSVGMSAITFFWIVGSPVGENVVQGVEGVGDGGGALVGALVSVGDSVGLFVGEALGTAVRRAALHTIPSSVTMSLTWRFGSWIGPSCGMESLSLIHI